MIDSFRGENRFLSNFHPSPVILDGAEYRTVEHAYQAAKTKDVRQRMAIADTEKASAAKRLGQMVTLRSDWEQAKLGVMENLLRQKFASGIMLESLIATSPQELVEGNTWGDAYWGVCGGVGQNNLGKLLMRIRDEVKP